MAHTVGDVAKIARISVRALHHYDEIGLLAPSARSDAGYRLYTDRDLERLQQILFFRELGLPLEEIKALLDDPSFDRRAALASHRAELVARIERLRSVLALVDRTLRATEGETTMTREEMFDVLGGFDPSRHEEEVKARWGSSPEHAESKRRTKSYRAEDWKEMRAQMDAIIDQLGRAFECGEEAASKHAMDLAEEARLHIDRWFYPCSRELHAALGEMYVEDPRFAAVYDARRPGLARFVRDAIRANAARG